MCIPSDTQRLYYTSKYTKVPEVVIAVLASMAYYWNLDIHTYVYWYASEFVCPNLHSHTHVLPFLSSREQCTSREVSYNKNIQRRSERAHV